MTHRERLLTALRGGVPDQVPVVRYALGGTYRDRRDGSGMETNTITTPAGFLAEKVRYGYLS